MDRVSGWGAPIVLISSLVLLSGCDSILGPGDDPARIDITGSRYTLDLIGDTIQLNTVVKTEDGEVLPNASVRWESRETAVAAVSAAGVVTGHGNGSAWVVASSGGARDSIRITVASPIPCGPVGEILLPDTVSGSLSGTDCRVNERYVNAWTVTLDRQTEVTVQLASSAFDAMLGLLDADGAIIRWDDDGGPGSNSLITATLRPGTYFIYATSFYPGAIGSYQLMIQEGAPPSPCPATATLAIGDTVTGETSADGCIVDGFYLDVWRVTLPTDTVLIIQVDSDDFHAALAVSDTLGRFLNGSGNGPGTSAWLEVHLLAGSYDLWLGARNEPETAGSYTLSVRPGPIFRVCEPVGTLGFPGSVSGELTAEDCFVHVGPGDPWSFELADSAAVDLSLTSDAFRPLLLVTDSVGDIRKVFQGDSAYTAGEALLEAGRYIVWALAGEDGRGGYTLSARVAGQMIDCEPDGSVTVGETISGALSTTDCRLPDGRYADVWITRLDTTSTVRVTVDSEKFDSFLYVADSTGLRLAWDDDGGGGTNAAVTLEFPAGLYQLWATSYGADVVGGYQLGVAAAGSGMAVPVLPGSREKGRPALPRGRGGVGLPGWALPPAGGGSGSPQPSKESGKVGLHE